MKTLLPLLAVAALAGCGSSDSGGVAAKPPPSVEEQTKSIQESTTMSPEGKAAAMAAIERNQAMGRGMAAHPQK